MQDGRVVVSRETSYAISDISKLPAKSKIFINGEKVTKGDAIYALQSLASSAMQYTETVVINYELSYSLTGDLYIEIPTDEEIEEAEELADSGEDEAYYEMLNDADGLTSVSSPGTKKK